MPSIHAEEHGLRDVEPDELHGLLMSPGTENFPDGGQSPVAMVLDHESLWMADIQPQGHDFDALLHRRGYEAVRRLGIDVDILPPGAPLHGYAAVLAPSLMVITSDAMQACAATQAVLPFGPRSGSKTTDFAIPPRPCRRVRSRPCCRAG